MNRDKIVNETSTQTNTQTGTSIPVQTSRFGPLTVDRNKVITMTVPILGFSGSRRYFLKPHADDSPFMWLQSLDEPDLAFVVIQPAVFDAGYRPKVNTAVRAELGIASEADQEILVILTIPRGKPQEMTANLLGPVVLNVNRRVARQVLLDPAQYDPCQPVLAGAGK